MKILHLSDIHFGRNYPRTKIMDPFEKRMRYWRGFLVALKVFRKDRNQNIL